MLLRPYQADLVEQCRRAYTKGFKAPCIVLPCGGGKSIIVANIARNATLKGNRVLFLVHRKELCEQITDTFNRVGVDMSLCDVMMVQTASLRIRKLKEPQLIITDENHHSLARSYRKIYETFENAKRIGVTATPVRLDGSGLADVNDTLIQGVSAKWLIENNFLAPYEYYAPSLVDLTDIKTSKGDFDTQQVEKAMLKKAIFGDVISNYRRYADGKQAICYCVSREYSIMMVQAFNQAGIEAKHIDATTPKDERAKIISGFKDGAIDILSNVDLISEGFDVPDCECAILLRPTKSLTLYIQQSMRCMRYKPNKRAIIIDHVGNYARFGLPDTDRKWSLDKKKKKNEFEDLDVVTCGYCFGTASKKHEKETEVAGHIFKIGDLRITCPHCDKPLYFSECSKCSNVFAKYSNIGEVIKECPQCGAVTIVKPREIEKDENKELIKIESFSLDFSDWRDCKTYGELHTYAMNHGYKQGWCYYKAKELGLLQKNTEL